MQKSKFEQFTILKSQGVPRLEIIKKLGVCESTYDNYNKRYKKEKVRVKTAPFSMERYFEGVMYGWYDSDKEVMAKKIGTSKPTLTKYEREYILKDFVRWLKLNMFSDSDIMLILKIKSKKDLQKYADNFVSVKSILGAVMMLNEYAGFNVEEREISGEINLKLSHIEKLLVEVEKLIRKSKYYNNDIVSNMISEINKKEESERQKFENKYLNIYQLIGHLPKVEQREILDEFTKAYYQNKP